MEIGETPYHVRPAVRWLVMLTIDVLAAFCFVSIKTGLEYAAPLAFAGLRTLLAGMTLLGLAWVARQRVLPAPGEGGTLVILALTATTATYGAMFGSAQQMDTGLASVLANIQPLLILVLANIALGERLTGTKLVAAIMGLVGILLILSPTLTAGPGGSFRGPALALTASLGAATATVIFKRARLQTGIIAATGWQLVLGSFPLVAVAGFNTSLTAVQWSPAFIAVLTFLALLGTATPTALWFWLLRRADAGSLSVFLFLIPVFGLLLGVILLDEHISILQAVGSSTIVLSLFMARAHRSQQRSTAVSAG